MRRKFLIDKSFQVKFVVKFCAIVLAAAVLLSLLVLWMSHDSTTVTIDDTQVLVKKTFDFIYPILFQALCIAAILAAIAVSSLTILMTHKISGPLYRLKVDIDKMTVGDYSVEFKTRRNDQLSEFVDCLITLANSLKTRQNSLERDINELKRLVVKNGPASAELADCIAKLEKDYC